MTLPADHITGATGLTLTVNASKAGSAFAIITPVVTEIGSGRYAIALTTTHTNTLGALDLLVTATGADPSDTHDQITPADFSDVATAATQSTAANTQATANGANIATLITGQNNLIATNPSVAQIAAGILVTPINLLATDTSGRTLLQPVQTGVTIPTVTALTNPVVASSVTGAVGSVTGSVGSVVAAVTAGTVTDKTGYGLAVGQNVATLGGLAPPTNFNLMSVDASGRTLLQPVQTGVVIPTVTSLTNPVVASSVTGAVGSVTGAVTVGTNNDKTGYTATTSNLPADYLSATEQTQVTGIKAQTDKIGFTGTGPYTVNTSATVAGNVIVGGYAAGQDPATLLLVTPANKIATDATGRTLLQPSQPGVTIPTVTALTNPVVASSVTANVGVGSYAAGQDPATLVLVTPANKIASTVAGGVIVATNGDKTGYTATASNLPADYLSTAEQTQVTGIKTQTDKIGFTGAGPYTVNANATLSGNVTIGGYAAGQDPATLLFGASFLTIPASGTTSGVSEVLTTKQMYALLDALPGGDNVSTAPVKSGTSTTTYYLRGAAHTAANITSISTVSYDLNGYQTGRTVKVAQPFPTVN